MNRQVVTVQLLTSYVRELVESDAFLADLWVEGEIAEAFNARSGHIYFTLRDNESRLKCVMFRAQAQRQRSLPRSGDQVAVHGRLSIYERDGNFQLYVDLLQPAGQGILALQLELLRQQLTLEGLFDPTRKRAIPRMPTTIGVVTSADGAVWHDIQHVLRRRFPLAHLILSPTAVQGDHAPDQIVRALDLLQVDGRAEVIIVARGGGSAEDLWCFNDERVVRAVFASRIPVVSGVGHETDWTLIDEVADLRAPTPSAAAELCSPSLIDLAERVVDAQQRAERVIVDRLGDSRHVIGQLNRALDHHSPTRLLQSYRSTITAKRETMVRAHGKRLAAERVSVNQYNDRLGQLIQHQLAAGQRQRELAATRLQALDPTSVLQRGYALVTSGATGAPIHRVRDVSRGTSLTVQLADGVLTGTVDGIAPSASTYASTTESSHGIA